MEEDRFEFLRRHRASRAQGEFCEFAGIAPRHEEEFVLVATQLRVDRLEHLHITASERRVAQMAATGMTNREIAQALFVTLKAVTLHLTHVYEKLAITGRTQLPGALGQPIA